MRVVRRPAARRARWFVKEAVTDRGRHSLERAWAFHRAVRHRAIVPQVHRIAVGSDGAAVVMPWREGEVLYPAMVGGPRDRTGPGSPMARFRALPISRVLAAFERVLDAHLAVEVAGHVAVDFYDGALLYDFGGDVVHLVDLDEYRRRSWSMRNACRVRAGSWPPRSSCAGP